MKNNFLIKFNTITNLIILSILLFGGVIWADSNGVWQRAEDIRAGIFGGDEGGGDFTFNTTVHLNDSVYYHGDELNNLYVNANGDTIYGDLNVTGNITMHNSLVATENYVTNSITTSISSINGLWNQSGTDLYYNAGNVGIGLSSPTQALDVNGNVKADMYCDGTGCYQIADFLAGGTGGGISVGWYATCPVGWVNTGLYDCDKNDGHDVTEDTCNGGGGGVYLCLNVSGGGTGGGGGSSNVEYLSGNANHGDIVPIPSGFTRAQCNWIVSLRASSGHVPTDNHNAVYDIRADPITGLITCNYRETAHSYFNNACSVNYLTVCKNNTGGSLSEVSSSLTNNGHLELSNGLILQWGVRTGTGPVTFSQPFPNGVFGVYGSVRSIDRVFAATSITNTGFNQWVGDTAGNSVSLPANWFALGY